MSSDIVLYSCRSVGPVRVFRKPRSLDDLHQSHDPASLGSRSNSYVIGHQRRIPKTEGSP